MATANVNRNTDLPTALYSIREVDNLLASGATIDIFPKSINVLIQLDEKTKLADVAETVTAVRVERER